MFNDDDDVDEGPVEEPYEPYAIDVLLPDVLVLLMSPDLPMFRYRILLTVKEPGVDEDQGRQGANIQRSWPVGNIPDLVYEFGGLDSFIRAQCRTMLIELFDSMFDTDTDTTWRDRVMSYTGQWYVSDYIHPSEWKLQPIEGVPQAPIHTLAAISFLGKIGRMV